MGLIHVFDSTITNCADSILTFIFVALWSTPAILLFCLIFHPIQQRIKNKLFPVYLRNTVNGKVYQLILYKGYDKHSGVVAYLKDLDEGYEVYAGDWYYDLVKTEKVNDKYQSSATTILKDSNYSHQEHQKPYLRLVKG
jgi:hypothetical protein